MTFLSPAFLWALPAALVPVALHLLNRRPPRRLAFSHIEWLRQAHRATMPQKRLREILLLILRTLFVALLALFFARPVVSRGGLFSASGANDVTVVLFDVSASMDAVTGGRSTLDIAKEQLQTFIPKLPAGSRVGLISYSDRTEDEMAPTDDRSRVTGALTALAVKPRPTDVLPALKQAYAMLANQSAGKKSILIVSDQARHGWGEAIAAPGHWENFDPTVRVLLWEAAAEGPNAGVSDATLQMTEEGRLKGQWSLHRQGEGDTAWKLVLNGRAVGQGTVAAKSPSDHLPLEAQLPEGGYYAGRLELRADAAAFDDAYYIAGRVPKGFRLLIVDGDAGLAPADSEAYYLRSALESPRDPRLSAIDVIRPEALPGVALERYDAMVLANVSSLAGREADILAWIRNGGGLLLTAGSRWPKPPDSPLGLFRTRAPKTVSEHPVIPDPKASFLGGVAGLTDFEWSEARVTTYVPLEEDAAAKPLITLSNGDPLLVRKQIGSGSVLCLTTSLDRAWTNLPAKPVYAPLFRELVAALADPLRDQASLVGFVDEPLRITLPPAVKSLTVIAPDGTATAGAIDKLGRLEWREPALPGLYQVRTDQPSDDFSFAVNMRRLDQEGDLRRVSEGEARSAFPGASVSWISAGTRSGEVLFARLQGRDATSLILALLGLILLAETILGVPFRRKIVSVGAPS